MIVTCSRCGERDDCTPDSEDYSDYNFCYKLHGCNSCVEYVMTQDRGWFMTDEVILCPDCINDLNRIGIDLIEAGFWEPEFEAEVIADNAKKALVTQASIVL